MILYLECSANRTINHNISNSQGIRYEMFPFHDFYHCYQSSRIPTIINENKSGLVICLVQNMNLLFSSRDKQNILDFCDQSQLFLIPSMSFKGAYIRFHPIQNFNLKSHFYYSQETTECLFRTIVSNNSCTTKKTCIIYEARKEKKIAYGATYPVFA